MRDYKEVTAKQRWASLRLTQKAIAEGSLKKPSKCAICDKTEGRIDYHNETYESPTEELFEICQGCHMRWHNRHRFRTSFIKYFITDERYKKLNQPMIAALKKERFLD